MKSKTLSRPRTLPSRKSQRTGLSPLHEDRLRRRLRNSAPSEPWVDEQIKTFTDIGPQGQPILCRYHDTTVFPPGGTTGTTMRWCHTCGRYTPRHCTTLIQHLKKPQRTPISSTLICDDCRIADDDQRYQELYQAGLFLRPRQSTSVISMRQLYNERKISGVCT